MVRSLRHGPAVGVVLVLSACPPGSAPSIFLGPPGTSATHVAVTVQQGQVVGETWRFRSVARNSGQESTAMLPEGEPTAKVEFPAVYAVVAQEWTGTTELALEALDRNGTVVGRAKGTVELQRDKGVATELVLGRPCTADAECADTTFCNGVEKCDDGTCQDGPDACQSAFECADIECLEAMRTCAVTVNHAACTPLMEGDGGTAERYCDPGAGCVRGPPCTTDAECQDTSLCNGAEVCAGYRCVAGVPIPLDDENACTTDACVEGQGRVNLPVPNGNACLRTGQPAGICLTGVCATSTCGDSFKDLVRNEQCDDGAQNSATLPNACRLDCRTPFCGDGVTDLGEQCDDGNMVEEDTCLGTCQRNTCGDGVVNTGVEQCDDGNPLETDACKLNCQSNICGDGIRNPAAEACDDGNMNPNDGCNTCRVTRWAPQITLGFGQSGGNPLNLALTYPEGLAQDRLGNLYFAEYGGRIWRVDAATRGLTRVAGAGGAGYGGDEGPATSAALSEPQGVVLDERGNLYFCDGANHAVRRIDRQGIITTLAGDGTQGFSGDTLPATRAQLNYPAGLARDRFGNLYIADFNNHRVRRIGTNGRMTTIAGTGTPGSQGDLQQAVTAELNGPWGVLVREDGRIIITERLGNRVRSIDPDGVIRTLAGDGTVGDRNGAAAQAQFHEPAGITLLPDGSLLVADKLNHRVRRVNAGTVTTFAGTGDVGADGDGGQAAAATFNQPVWVTSDAAGVVHISDEYNQRVRRVEMDGTISTVVGLQGAAYAGFGNSAKDAFMVGPNGVAVGQDGSIYIAEYEAHRIRRVFATGVIRTIAGTGVSGDEGDDGPAASALISFPDSLAMDPDGNLLFTDSGNNRIRSIDPLGRITTIAGTGTPGFSGDGMAATLAELDGPSGIAVDVVGNIYFSDAYNHRIRRIDVAGDISTVAGDGSISFSGDNGPALLAGIAHVYGVAVDGAGNVYMADDGAHRVRRFLPGGNVTTVAGDGNGESSGDGLQATAASLAQPGAVLVDAMGALIISDTYGNRIRKVATTGIISTLVGTGEGAFQGDFGPATLGAISRPYQLALDAAGNLLITDYGNGLLRSVSPAGTLMTVAGSPHPGDGPFAAAQLSDPSALVHLGTDLLVADGQAGRVRRADLTNLLLATVAGYPRAPVAASVPALNAPLIQGAAGLAYDAAQQHVYGSVRNTGRLYRISLIDPTDPQTWVMEVFAGSGDMELNPHADGPLAAARFNGPTGMVFHAPSRTLFLTEAGNHDVRAIKVDTPTAADCVTTVAGLPGAQGFYGESIAASGALLDSPEALTVTPGGDLYIADTGNHRVRRVDRATGVITTVIGDGTPAASGAGAPALFFTVDTPRGVAVDVHGNLFITSRYALRMVTAGADGTATGQDEVLTLYGVTPRDDFPESVTQCLTAVLLAQDNGSLWMTDACQGFLMRLTRESL